jgi:hypothetical protein
MSGGKPGKSRLLPPAAPPRPEQPDPNGNRHQRRAAGVVGAIPICSICGGTIEPEIITGWTGGHNARPINDGVVAAIAIQAP